MVYVVTNLEYGNEASLDGEHISIVLGRSAKPLKRVLGITSGSPPQWELLPNPRANATSMDQAQDYDGRVSEVRAILEARLGTFPGNPDRFGNGLFVYGGAEYGEQGKLGNAVWLVSRTDDPLRRCSRITFEWRDITPEKIAEMLMQAYDEFVK